MIADGPQTRAVKIVSGGVETVLERSHLVVAASGTVTLQAAFHGVPMVIIYKVSPLSYWLGRALVRVNHIGLVNLIAGKQIVPEFVQHHACAGTIADEVIEILGDRARIHRIKQELIQLRDMLGGPGASERVADIALRMLAAVSGPASQRPAAENRNR
jgi:lipid-A-disaccharide synthase